MGRIARTPKKRDFYFVQSLRTPLSFFEEKEDRGANNYLIKLSPPTPCFAMDRLLAAELGSVLI
jgi:hypothetical protein